MLLNDKKKNQFLKFWSYIYWLAHITKCVTSTKLQQKEGEGVIVELFAHNLFEM